MKILLLLAFVLNGYAAEDVLTMSVHKKYCALKVARACRAIKTDPSLGFTDQENKLLNQAKQEKTTGLDPVQKQAVEILTPSCKKGNQEACYEIELIKSI